MPSAAHHRGSVGACTCRVKDSTYLSTLPVAPILYRELHQHSRNMPALVEFGFATRVLTLATTGMRFYRAQCYMSEIRTYDLPLRLQKLLERVPDEPLGGAGQV